MDFLALYLAAKELGHADPISVEPDGTIWTGTNNAKNYLTDTEQKAVIAKVNKAAADKASARQAVLDRLGITADEAALLLG
jgi:hypothetical protein